MYSVKLTEPIWIIEDDRNTASLIATYLEREGYETRILHDGSQALASMPTSPVGFVILDVMLPGADGWEICREIRK